MADSTWSGPAASEALVGAVCASPVILECVFRHLPVPALQRCQCVCRLWNEVGARVRRKRRQTFWVFKVHPSKPSDRRHLRDTPAAAPSKQDIGYAFVSALRQAPSDPRHAIVFCSCHFCEQMHLYFDTYKAYETEWKRNKVWTDGQGAHSYGIPEADFLARFLPQGCRMVFCAAPGIVGTTVDGASVLEAEHSPGLSAFFLPHIPGMDIYTFPVPSDDSDPEGATPDPIPSVTGIPTDRTIKCLLLFGMDVPLGRAREVVRYYLRGQGRGMALGGAIVDDLAAPPPCGALPWPPAIGVAFCGDEVGAASVVLEPSVSTPEAAEQAIRRLKGETGTPRFGFMFACCGRGSAFYRRWNVEADAFRRVFPGVPLFGVFGNGEIGVTCVPERLPAQRRFKFPRVEEQQGEEDPQWIHTYTTVMVLITAPTDNK